MQRRRDGSRDLLDFNRVRQPVAKMVGITARKNLRLVFETAEGSRMNDPVAVALKVIAVSVWRLRDTTPARIFDLHRVSGKHVPSLSSCRRVSNAGKRHRLGDAFWVSCSLMSIASEP
jgi:hypothetical protein